MILKIKKNSKIEDVVRYYEQLQIAIEKEERIDLLLPFEFTNAYVGLVPSLLQFVATWIRYHDSGKLLLDVKWDQDAEIARLYENELVFPVVSMVWNSNGVYSHDGATNLRSYLKKFNEDIFSKMLKAMPLKGQKLFLTSFDHLPKDKGILPCFELNNDFVKNESLLFDNISKGLTDVLTYSAEYRAVFNSVKKDLIGIIYELYKNTYEWGKTDTNNVPFDPNVRGVYCKFFKKRKNVILKELKEHAGLVRFFESEIHHENSVGEIGFAEISVFDSGLGFIDKYKSLNDEVGLSDIDILRKCLIKRNTSARGLEKGDKGIGLDRILNLLDKRGFLRIKTGRIDVYRNLITNPYQSVNNEELKNMELFDWRNFESDNFSVEYPASGSLITVIFPLSLSFIGQPELSFYE